MMMDIERHAALPFPQSLPEFQGLFPDDAACAEYLEKLRWADGFVCPYCGATGEPFRIAPRPGVLTCRKCRRQTGLTVGTVMERSHTPLSTWFWAAYLVAPSRLRQSQDVVDRYPSRGQRAASTGLPQRIYVSLQPALLPVQCLPLVARNCGGGEGTDLRRALFRQLGASYE